MSEATKTIIKHIIAVLDLPGSIPEQLVLAKAIVKAMTGNTFFPTPSPALATVTAHINTADEAETAAKSRAAGTVQARDAAMEVVTNDLRALLAYVQGIADGSPKDAEVIITSAGMKVKKQGEINKQDFTADNSISGIIKLLAKGAELSRAAHQWGMSADGVNWLPLALDIPPTLAAHTQVTGLTKGAILYFRHREILKEGPGEWSQTISIVVT